MASKTTTNKKEPKKSRRWAETELNTLAGVLADPEDSFAMSLERLELKKSSNNEVFEYKQKEFISRMEEEDFQIRI